MRKPEMMIQGVKLKWAAALVVAAVGATEVQGFSSLPSSERTSGAAVVEAFSAQREVLQASSAVLYSGLRFFGYGVVVSEDGYVLVKASEMRGKKKVSLRVGEEKFTEVQEVARCPRWDLVLLKVEAEGLKPVVWADSAPLAQGTWVVANGATTRLRRRAAVGIVSAKYRALEGLAPAVLGVAFERKKGSLMIEEVTEKTGAELAGLKKGDLITKFAGKVVTTREALVQHVRDHIPGEVVEVEFLRDGKALSAQLKLMARSAAYKQQKSRNDAMSGDVSKRRDSFPMVMQTDIRFGNGRHVGGPLLNLDGECVGMNIARANRVESFAIPVKELREELAKMLASVENPS